MKYQYERHGPFFRARGCLARLVRILRVSTGWMILAAIPLSVLAIYFSEGLVEGLIKIACVLCFGVIGTGYVALGVWLISGGKSSDPNV